MGYLRGWARKGVVLPGARAVLALSFERIHRSNLIGMGILPLRLPLNRRPQSLNLLPSDTIEIDASIEAIRPRGDVSVRIRRGEIETNSFQAIAAIETSLECEILRVGRLLPLILKPTPSP